ncbi:hypothetical protein DFQ26_001916 [Actinomortierella ambigua]|nr:hypothetical protein DFQ26_001916 [Actinomortierella ambigua]
MRLFLGCLLVAVLPAALFANPEPFCEDKISRTGRLFGRPAHYDLQQQFPGWLHIVNADLYGELDMDTEWYILGHFGALMTERPRYFYDLTYTFNEPKDLQGSFLATFSGGQAVIKWNKSGATITGRINLPDRTVKGMGMFWDRNDE